MNIEQQSLEPGLVLFIKKKLENAVPLREIMEMLLRAGFSQKQINEAMLEIRLRYPDTHQDIAAGNSFLPPLIAKEGKIEDVRLPQTVAPAVALKSDKKKEGPAADEKKGLLKGRLRRRDFILGFLLFFGEGVVILSIVLGAFSFIFPDFTAFIDEITSPVHYGLWLLAIPVFLAPVSILLLSIIARRLHDLALPGGIALGFLVFFIDPTNGILSTYGIWGLQVMMAIIFLLLLTKKGNAKANQFGSAPSQIKGSMFSRIFNI